MAWKTSCASTARPRIGDRPAPASDAAPFPQTEPATCVPWPERVSAAPSSPPTLVTTVDQSEATGQLSDGSNPPGKVRVDRCWVAGIQPGICHPNDLAPAAKT